MSLLSFFAAHRSPFLTLLGEVGRLAGDQILLIILLCVLYWCVDKKKALRLGFSFFFAATLVQGLKVIFRVPRPWVLNPALEPLESALPGATGYSFPSGHTQTAVSMYGTLAWEASHLPAKILLVILFLMTGWSRLYCGVHTPADVCVAAVIALLFVYCTEKWIAPLLEQDKFVLPSVILGCSSLLAFAVTLILLSNGYIDAANAADAVKTTGAALGFSLACIPENKLVCFQMPAGKKIFALRIAVGLILLLGLRVGLKPLVSGLGIFGDCLRYMFLIIWGIFLYPLLFTALEKRLSK